mmetsp:Transcript_25144/g.39740  ORF Transcript_25144/g.39740 Transcript_25144/m.39740 type:complete len:83 (-) Transcript_25144:18-266(-)
MGGIGGLGEAFASPFETVGQFSEFRIPRELLAESFQSMHKFFPMTLFLSVQSSSQLSIRCKSTPFCVLSPWSQVVVGGKRRY